MAADETRTPQPNKTVLKSIVKSSIGTLLRNNAICNNKSKFYDKIIQVANTYRLYSKNPFHVETVEKIMRTVFLGVFEQPDFVYEPNVCSKLACDLAQDIKEQVKALNYDRYKLVSLVTIGERKYQYQYATLKFLWDAERDKYALCQFMDNPKFYAIGLVIAVYYD